MWKTVTLLSTISQNICVNTNVCGLTKAQPLMMKHIRVHTDFDAQNPTYSEKYSVFQVQFLGSWPFNTTDGHPDTQYLTDPPFHSSVHKSAKQSIVFDVPKLSNDLEENTRSTTFTACFRNSSTVTYLHSAPPPPPPPPPPCLMWCNLAKLMD